MTETVLDLPIERQKELAALQGLSHGRWVETMKAHLSSSEEYSKALDESRADLPPDEAERLQEKVDSATH